MTQKLYPNAYEKAKEIAKSLPGFRAETCNYDDGKVNDRFAYLVGAAGEKLTLSVTSYGSQTGRIEVRGDYPRGPDGEYLADNYVNGNRLAPPRISVNGNRAGNLIAKDIERRFLPGYRALLVKVNELKASRETHKNKMEHNVQALRAVYGGALNRGSDGFSLPFVNLGAYGDVESVSGESASIKLSSLPIELAKKVLQVLADADADN